MENVQFEKEIREAIFQINPKIDIEALENEDWLTGDKHRFSAIDLTYLFFTLEKQYGISFDAQDLKDYGFVTVQGIAQAVRNALAKQGQGA